MLKKMYAFAILVVLCSFVSASAQEAAVSEEVILQKKAAIMAKLKSAQEVVSNTTDTSEATPSPPASLEKSQVFEDNSPDIAPRKSSIKLDLQVDEDSSVFTLTRLVKLSKLNASEVEPFVRKSLSKYGSVSVNSAANILVVTDREPKLTDLVELIKNLDELGMNNFVRLETRVIPLANIQAGDIVDIIRGRLSSDGVVQADSNLNVLIVTDVTGKIDYIMNIVTQLDKPPVQVVIATKILLLHDDNFSDVGIDLNSLLSQTSFGYASDKTRYYNREAQYYNKDTSGNINRSIDVNFGNSNSYRPQLDAMISLMTGTGRAELIADTRIVTVNNQQGSVRIGMGNGYEDLVVTISPHIGTGELMKINFVASSGEIPVASPTSTDLNQSTSQNQNQKRTGRSFMNSTFMARSGETFVVGGLDSQKEMKINKNSPILSKLPVIGQLFTKSVRIVGTDKVVVFFTPSIVPPGGDAAIESDAVLMNYKQKPIVLESNRRHSDEAPKEKSGE